jgi:hypothetical protein
MIRTQQNRGTFGEQRRRRQVSRLGVIVSNQSAPFVQDYEVSARIVSQTQEDGSPLDTPLELSTCENGGPCGSGMASDDRAAAAVRAVAAAEARDGAATGGNGSGGFWPFPGGLPFHLPKLPNGSEYVFWALVGAAGLYVLSQGKRR